MSEEDQLNFIDVLFPEDVIVHPTGDRCIVFPSDHGWTAQISFGWWIGHGKTREAAISDVVKKYYAEMECQ